MEAMDFLPVNLGRYQTEEETDSMEISILQMLVKSGQIIKIMPIFCKSGWQEFHLIIILADGKVGQVAGNIASEMAAQTRAVMSDISD